MLDNGKVRIVGLHDLVVTHGRVHERQALFAVSCLALLEQLAEHVVVVLLISALLLVRLCVAIRVTFFALGHLGQVRDLVAVHGAFVLLILRLVFLFVLFVLLGVTGFDERASAGKERARLGVGRAGVGGGCIGEGEELVEVVALEEALLARILEYLVGEELLEYLPMVDLLLDGAGGEQAVDGHVARLTDAPGAFARLQVVARIPVRVEDDDLVGADEVETQAAHLGRQQEEKYARVRVEAVDELGAHVGVGGAVHAHVRVVVGVLLEHVLLDDVEHDATLREQEHARLLTMPHLQQRVHHDHLARALVVAVRVTI